MSIENVYSQTMLCDTVKQFYDRYVIYCFKVMKYSKILQCTKAVLHVVTMHSSPSPTFGRW
jgi:hypothetical protein